MSVIAKLRYLRIAPRKVRLVTPLIKGKEVNKAEIILKFTVKKAAQPILKLLKSAVASARHNFQLDEKNLYISKITVDEGPKFKRWRARARGRAAEIQKKTSHITLILEEIVTKSKGSKKIAKKLKLKPTLEVEKSEELEKTEKEDKAFFGKWRNKSKMERARPKIEKGLKRIFRRKSF
ncbi:MAG: 50S ribosomal protein L22 [Patescibacteria group bacterium]